ncbi:MAG: p-hydroxycinnamoyl CoA hydratase/lyase [Gammaproteobacteria bacterium]|jgi:feruloyl-CoA hydratase/lyase|nr:p-hydroxycinnamoyl CoA hydratase/lyase [Gammaproteobacteria bacterium]
MSKYKYIIVEIENDIATITFNRPEKKNAMSPDLHAEMCVALDEVAAAKVKVMVLTGSGNAFVGGMDLEKCFFDNWDDPEKFVEGIKPSFEWMKHLKTFPAVTVAKVNGWCFGGGMEVVGLCDIAIVAEESTWGLSEVNFGIFPGGGTTWTVVNNMPSRKQGLYYTLTADTFNGKEAVDLGWASKAVPLAELDAHTDKIVAGLVKKGRVVMQKCKEVYERIDNLNMEFPEAVDYEIAKLFELSRLTDDDWIRSGLQSFKKREYKPGLEEYKLTKDV